MSYEGTSQRSPLENALNQIALPLTQRTSETPYPTASRTLSTVGLFTGVGGIELGLHGSAHTTTLMCEIEPGARAVLRSRFSEVELHDDVSSLSSLPARTDLLIGGFPCQDLSQAGKTAGIEGARSGLVGEVFRLLRANKVPLVVLENVPFMLQLSKGRAMEVLVAGFEDLGYRWAYRVVDSRSFGLPQRRRRVVFVAALDEDPKNIIFHGNETPPTPPPHDGIACGFYWTEGVRGLGWAVDAVPTLKAGSAIGIPSPPAIWMPSGQFVKPDIRDAERLQGFPADWTAPSTEVKRAGHRWKLVGNAVSVDMARWLGDRLANPMPYDRSLTRPFRRKSSWPTVAWGGNGERHGAALTEWPSVVNGPSLADFLIHPTAPLSLRATTGFIKRTEKGSLRFPKGFIEAIQSYRSKLTAKDHIGRNTNSNAGAGVTSVRASPAP